MIQYVNSHSQNVETVYTASGMYDYPVTPYLLANINWNKIFSLILSFREEYNDNSGRFLKSDLISLAFERYSNGKIQFVNEVGCDFYLPENDCRIELKSGIQLFQTSRARNTVEMKLKNFNGNGTKLEKTFDYLLMVQPNLVGIISYEKLLPYVYSKADGFYIKVDLKDVELFKESTEVKHTQKNLTNIRRKYIEYCLDEIDALYE